MPQNAKRHSFWRKYYAYRHRTSANARVLYCTRDGCGKKNSAYRFRCSDCNELIHNAAKCGRCSNPLVVEMANFCAFCGAEHAYYGICALPAAAP